jgi:hypothetical protein
VTHRETVLSGTTVLSSDGENLGTLADMFIDEDSGRVVGYIISGGFLADTLHGKKFLPAPPGLSVGPHAAIAHQTAEAQLKGQISRDASLPEVTSLPDITTVPAPVSSAQSSTQLPPQADISVHNTATPTPPGEAIPPNVPVERPF